MKRQHGNITLQPQQSLENLTKSRGQSHWSANQQRLKIKHEKDSVNSQGVVGGTPLTDDSNGTKSNIQHTIS